MQVQHAHLCLLSGERARNQLQGDGVSGAHRVLAASGALEGMTARLLLGLSLPCRKAGPRPSGDTRTRVALQAVAKVSLECRCPRQLCWEPAGFPGGEMP